MSRPRIHVVRMRTVLSAMRFGPLFARNSEMEFGLIARVGRPKTKSSGFRAAIS